VASIIVSSFQLYSRITNEWFDHSGIGPGFCAGITFRASCFQYTAPVNKDFRLNQDSEVLAGKLQTASDADMEVSEGPQEEMLWVDKYAPRSFTELLSDEQTNREVRILQLWYKTLPQA
jgi:hypothetical protein